MLPVVQVGKVDLSVVVHVLRHLDLHVLGRPHVADGRVVGVGVQQPHGHGDVVVLPLVGDGDRAVQVDQVALVSVVEDELVLWKKVASIYLLTFASENFFHLRVKNITFCHL